MIARCRDRRHAGSVLAGLLAGTDLGPRPIVLGLPRGGTLVASEVARRHHADLDLCVVRKIAAPRAPEYALGAIAGGGVLLLDRDAMRDAGVEPDELGTVIASERRELARREAAYRPGRPAPSLANRVVVLVDDGLATGWTMRAAVASARRLGAKRLIVAVPVGSQAACARIAREVEACVCPIVSSAFSSVGEWYDDFTQTTDDDVLAALAEATPSAMPGRP